MLRTLAHPLVILQLLLFPTSCASGQRYAYDNVTLNLPMVGQDSVALLVVDQRQPVVGKQYPASFTGTYQASPSEQEPVLTKSGAPFADDVGNVVRHALERGGYTVGLVRADPGLSSTQAFERLRGEAAEQLILIEVLEWQSNTFKNMQIDYELHLSVFNSSGALKGQSRVRGSDQLPPSHTDSESAQSAAAGQALAHKLGMLFSEPKVASAFRRRY